MENQFTHLTDEQFADLLLGASPAAVTEHLGACPRCAQEAQRVSGAIGSFAQQSRLWAERRAASLSAHSPEHDPGRQPAFPWLHIPTRPQAWTVAGLAVALALGIGISLRIDHLRPAEPRGGQQVAAKLQPAAVVSPTILKSDNALLTAIDGELRADDSTTSGMYGLSGSSRGVHSRSAKRTSN
jgi:hypothetical protein